MSEEVRGPAPAASEPSAPNVAVSVPEQRRVQRLRALLEVAKALASEHDLDRLLHIIADEVKKVVEADRCSVFLVDEERHEIWTVVAQGLEPRVLRLPVGSGIAGYVALTGETVNIPDCYADPRFNPEVDRQTGYRTKNMLCVPMVRARGDVAGVMVAINKLPDGPFNVEDEELLAALGSNAATAVDNARLQDEIEALFEGFVQASVLAIESRDPSTSGHSARVAVLTLGLADAVERAPPSSLRHLRFDAQAKREIRYAALLHDFGKVGVREHVLVKANKLHPHEHELLRSRFELVRATIELDAARRRAALFADGGAAGKERELAALERDVRGRLEELARSWDFVTQCNRPTVLAEGDFRRLEELAAVRFADLDAVARPLLTEREVEILSIRRGSLSPEERREIESHVEHTYRFLAQIPWTRALARVPEIAYAHHEKLDGQGYPRALPSHQIPVEAKMMTVADIYDALTAADRPYKKAVPHEKALDILADEAKRGQLDPELFQVFVEARVHERLGR